MALRLANLTLARVLSWLALLARSEATKDVEILVLGAPVFRSFLARVPPVIHDVAEFRLAAGRASGRPNRPPIPTLLMHVADEQLGDVLHGTRTWGRPRPGAFLQVPDQHPVGALAHRTALPHDPATETSGRAVACPDPTIVTVAAAMKQINTPRRSWPPSSRLTTPAQRYIAILSGG